MIKNAIRKIKCILKGEKGWRRMVLLYLLAFLLIFLALFISYFLIKWAESDYFDWTSDVGDILRRSLVCCSCMFSSYLTYDMLEILFDNIRNLGKILRDSCFLVILVFQLCFTFPLLLICTPKSFGLIILYIWVKEL